MEGEVMRARLRKEGWENGEEDVNLVRARAEGRGGDEDD